MKKLWAILGCSVLILSSALAVSDTPVSAIENVTIEDVSSEYTSFGSDRTAGNTIDGSGLSTDADGKLYHSNNPEDMWLSSKDRQARITFDVENYYDLSRVHVWSYNEGNKERGRVKGVEILVASEPDPAYNPAKKFESLGTFTLPSAPGTDRYYGKAIDLNDFGAADNVRLVQFRFPGRGGLSEVKFYGSPLSGGERRRKQARRRREEYMKRKKTGTLTKEERFAVYNERRMQTLKKMAGDESLWGAIARLYLGKEVEKANQIIMKKDLGHWGNHIRQLALYEMFNANTGHRARGDVRWSNG